MKAFTQTNTTNSTVTSSSDNLNSAMEKGEQYKGAILSRWVQVRFGNPEQDCRRYGICKMEDLGEWMPVLSQNEEGFALAHLTIINEKARLIFFSQSMSESTQKRYFSNEHFIMEADAEVLLQDIEWVLCKGNYVFEEEEERIRILINAYKKN